MISEVESALLLIIPITINSAIVLPSFALPIVVTSLRPKAPSLEDIRIIAN